MKMKGMLLASLTLLSGAVMLTACSANQRKASDSKTLYLMQTGDILSLDNSNQANLTQWNVLEQSMEGMYRAGKNGKLIPAMATSIVKPTNSGRTYTYHLRKNVRWSNGDPGHRTGLRHLLAQVNGTDLKVRLQLHLHRHQECRTDFGRQNASFKSWRQSVGQAYAQSRPGIRNALLQQDDGHAGILPAKYRVRKEVRRQIRDEQRKSRLQRCLQGKGLDRHE